MSASAWTLALKTVAKCQYTQAKAPAEVLADSPGLLQQRPQIFGS